MRRSSVLPALLVVNALALFSGCGERPIFRKFLLTPDVALPTGTGAWAGTSLKVNTSGLEPLVLAARYVAWAEVGDARTALGELVPGQVLTFTFTGTAVAPAAVTALVVTEELTDPVLPVVLGRVRLRGAALGALEPPLLKASALAAVGGEVRVEDDRLMVMTSGLPRPGEGLDYAVWARFTPGPDCPAVGGGYLFMGNLDETGMLDATLPYLLATIEQVVVTIHSYRGRTEALSPLRVLSGRLTLPAPGAQTTHSH